MDNGQIFDLVNLLIRKEKEGNTITPDDFSKELYMSSIEKGNADYEYYEQSRVITDSLRSLVKSESISLTNGIGDFTASISDYWHLIGITTPLAKLSVLTEAQFDEYKYSDLLEPTTDFPVCKISGDNVVVLPDSIPSVDFSYLSTPAVPFYDYYIDVNDDYVYMPVGSSHLLASGEEYRDGTTSDTVNSISVEMSYPNNERVQVVYMLLQKLGITLNEQDAVQYGLAKEQKEELT